MKMRFRLLAFLLLCYITGAAQHPELTVKNYPRAVYLQRLNTTITVTGNIATTTMEMTFFNSSQRILEGELVFPLPEGAAVSAYAIDINGVLRGAVPVEKEKGTRVFEAIEHRQVDPGLLEKTEGNNFRTRIYPLPANGSRRVLITYDEELLLNSNHSLRYRLPLDYNKPIDHFTLNISVVQSSFKPQWEDMPDDNIAFSEWNNNYSASLQKTDFTPGHSLSFSIPKNSETAEVMMQQVGANYYFLINSFLKKESRPKPLPDEIAVIWDVSLSGQGRDIKKELQLLGSYINKKKNCSIRLATINNEYHNLGVFRIENGNWQPLRKTIEAFVYDGGTNYSRIDLPSTPAAEYLFFTDGLSTLSSNQVAQNGHPVYTITSSPRADYAWMQSLAQETGAAAINLNKLNQQEAMQLLTEQALQLLCIKQNTDISEHYPSIPQPIVNSCAVAGISSSANTAVVLQYGYGTKIMFEKTVQLNYNQHQAAQINLQKVWAQKKIAELDINYENNKALISQLGKQFSIVTRNTSLIVLENIIDYVQYEIDPPAELRTEYDRIIKQRLAARRTQQVLAMNNATRYMEELVQWWNADFRNSKPVPEPSVATDTIAAPAGNQRLEEVVVTGYGQQRRREVTVSAATVQDVALQGTVAGVAVRSAPGNNDAYKNKADSNKPDAAEEKKASIAIKPWTPERSYLKTMAAASKENKYAAYLSLRAGYMNTPSFYFDMAAWFFLQKDSANGNLILSNLAELDMENHELYKLLGFKLKETGRYQEEVFVYRKVLQWRPQEPQSYRDYGLALADAGMYQQALDTLYTAISKQYDGEVMSNYHGIEETIVTEINQLVTLHGEQLNLTGIDKKLLHDMPVDTRVVLSWNMNDTDIDLWLTDPNGEKCYYSHKTTAIGGRISDDFTNGYGPEQFLLKKAIKGVYSIEANFYGERQLKLAGPTTVMAEIYTHYASGRQQRKIITIQLEKSGEQTLMVGKFSFEK